VEINRLVAGARATVASTNFELQQEYDMPKFHIAIAAISLLMATALPSFAQEQGSCGAEARRIEQIVRTMPNTADQANAELYVLQAERAAQANDERACRSWLDRVASYIQE
jgi:hypothetical protein